MTDENDMTFGSFGVDEMTRRLITDPSNRPKCTEDDWRMYWLPLFIGAIKVKDVESPDAVAPMMEWTRVSRSVMQSVDVIDRTGKVLFTIPPLMRRVDIGEQPRDITLSGIIRHSTLLRDAGRPNKANEVLSEYILSHMEIEADILDELRIWNDIFSRYEESKFLVVDIDALFSSSSKSPDVSSSVSEDVEQGPDFDELEL